jgi:hypothetical protein
VDANASGKLCNIKELSVKLMKLVSREIRVHNNDAIFDENLSAHTGHM